MPNLKELKIDFDWKQVVVTDADYKEQSPNQLKQMLFQLYLIRTFENKLLELKNADLIHGPVHTSIGQEGVAVGTMASLCPNDGISGTHRAHHQYLAKACSFFMNEGYDPLSDKIDENVQDYSNILLAEIMGLSLGCCSGRGGSMHLCSPEIGVLGTNAIVGGGIPLATGSAFAEKYKKTGNIVVSFFGDGAINQGAFHEALNLAGAWKLPIIYILENNLYAVATGVAESAAVKELAVRAASYGMPAITVDGMDPLAMKLAVQHCADGIQKTSTPHFIEAKTYRDYHHAGDIPGSAFGYRTKEEEAQWKARDPLENFSAKLISLKIINEAQDQQLKTMVNEIIAKAETYCCDLDGEKKQIKENLKPTAESVTFGLRSDKTEFDGIEFTEPTAMKCDKKMKFVEAISSVTGRWMKKDPDVFVLGEEVGHMKGGPYLATKGLPKRFPGRVLDTPISEAGFTGLAGGAAMSGLKPVVEIMFPDFALVAADQIFNQVGKLRHMYGGDNVDMPFVMRTRIAVGCGYGGQHSMDPTALFSLFSGWTILSPTTAADYIGLFNSAMQSKDPVLMVEHYAHYDKEGLVPDNLDYFIEIGKAAKIHNGSDVTVLTYSYMTDLVKQAAIELEAEGISVDAIDLRTLSLNDIDYETIGESFMRTLNMVIVEQSPASNSIGARIGYECQRRFFDYLDSPIAMVTGADVPTPVSKWAELATMPTIDDIKDSIRKSNARQL